MMVFDQSKRTILTSRKDLLNQVDTFLQQLEETLHRADKNQTDTKKTIAECEALLEEQRRFIKLIQKDNPFQLNLHNQKQLDRLLEETNFFKNEDDAFAKVIAAGLKYYHIKEESQSQTIFFRSQKEINDARKEKWRVKREKFDQKIASFRKKLNDE